MRHTLVLADEGTNGVTTVVTRVDQVVPARTTERRVVTDEGGISYRFHLHGTSFVVDPG